jgi:uncharacterized protein YwgA
MLQVEQAGLVLALAEALRKHGSWTGETHVQKASYFLQVMLEVPLNVKFILYKHGPFSFDLRDMLSEMEAADMVKWEPRPIPYGPSVAPGANSARVVAMSRAVRTFSSQIEFVAEKLASKKVTELERLATALYVSVDQRTSSSDRPLRINTLKPHVSVTEAEAAVNEMDQIFAEAVRSGLINSRTVTASGA